jgi:hypothetical protein
MTIDRDSILSSMSVNVLRRILALLIVTAYVGATMFQVAPVYASDANMGSSSMNGMMHEQDGQSDKMPCKGVLPGCVTDLGCIFLVSLPAPTVAPFTVTAWSSVIYAGSSQALRGRSIQPALGPPISLA